MHWVPECRLSAYAQDPQHFAYRYDQAQWSGRDIVVVVPRGQDWMWEVAASYFDGFQPLDPVAITRNGQTVITLDLPPRQEPSFSAETKARWLPDFALQMPTARGYMNASLARGGAAR